MGVMQGGRMRVGAAVEVDPGMVKNATMSGTDQSNPDGRGCWIQDTSVLDGAKYSADNSCTASMYMRFTLVYYTTGIGG